MASDENRVLTDCFVCTPNPSHHLDIVRQNGEGDICFPGLGALTEGYVLVVPTEHVSSVTQLPEKRVLEMEDFILSIANEIERLWGPAIIFEHGGKPGEASSSCLDHCHVHLMPVRAPDECLEPREWRTHDSMAEAVFSIRDVAPYHLVRIREGLWVTRPDSVKQSQYMRRLVARDLGISDEWDYLLFPFLENMAATIDKLMTTD